LADKDGGPSALARAFHDSGFHQNILVDWSDNNGHPNNLPFYPTAADNVQIVGEITARLVVKLVNNGASLSNIHCIGHSLGAHSCGNVGKKFKQLTGTSDTIGKITALDPAGPLFENYGPSAFRLAPTDADYVIAYHTDAEQADNFDILHLGTWVQLADTDIYFNTGDWQPGCDMDNPIAECAHGIVWDFLKGIVAEGGSSNCEFKMQKCEMEFDSHVDYDTNKKRWTMGHCKTGAIHDLTFNMGKSASNTGTFYIDTTFAYPYCAGVENYNSVSLKKQKISVSSDNGCTWYRSNYGEMVECPNGQAVSGVCGSGWYNDCKYGSHWWGGGKYASNMFRCCPISSSATPICSVRYSVYGRSASCVGNEYLKSVCGSRRTDDCKVSYSVSDTNRANDYEVSTSVSHYFWNTAKCCETSGVSISAGSCEWKTGNFGSKVQCPSGKVGAGFCGSGVWRDCPKNLNDGWNAVGILCCTA